MSQLHTGGVDGERDIDAVVNKKLGMVALTKHRYLIGELEDLFTAEIFFPQLNCADTAVQSLFDNGAQIAPLG